MHTDITALLDDAAKFPGVLSRLAREAAADVVSRGHFSEMPTYVEHAIQILATRHCDLVFGMVRSPIERVWINSLQVQFLRSSSMLVTTPRIVDFPAFHKSFSATLNRIDEFLEWYRGNGGTLAELDSYFDQLARSGQLDPVEHHRAYCDTMDYGVMPFRHAFHISLQAGFPRLGPGGGDIRIDALIWRPDRPDLLVAVECDGYAYHSSKQSFTQDRQRDRRLSSFGVRVFRFSGSEINRDPPQAVGELYNYLNRAVCDREVTQASASL